MSVDITLFIHGGTMEFFTELALVLTKCKLQCLCVCLCAFRVIFKQIRMETSVFVGIGATIHTHRETQCLPLVGF